MDNLVTIVGPTGVGKSRLALQLATDFNGEIVSADSRQVYRHLNIGTAKPGRQDLALIPHHLIDIINPDEPFSLAQYQELANGAINGILQHQKQPLLVGGSGQYVWSVLEGWAIPRVPPNPDLRHALEKRVATGGIEELYHELERLDPAAAVRIDRYNPRRIVRALEIARSPSVLTCERQASKPPPCRKLIIGLTADRAELYRRIDTRVDTMIQQGLVEEVKKLVNMGYGLALPAMSGIGYRQIGMFLKSEILLEEAIRQIKSESHRLVRQQFNWFSLKDDRIRWFDIRGRVGEEITTLVAEFIEDND